MHAAMKYLIRHTIENNNIVSRENPTTGFITYVILSKDNKHLMTVYHNWKFDNYFVYTANDRTVTEGATPQSRLTMKSKHHYDLEEIANACFNKVHNNVHSQTNTRRPVSDKLLQFAATKMNDTERARFLALLQSVRTK